MSYYNNKLVWITGASAGIGKAFAISCANQGARLLLSSRRLETLQEVKALCQNSSSVDLLALDLNDHESLDNIIASNHALISQVDILINNAGISQRSKVVDTDFSVYKKLMDVNYLGTVKLSLAVIPHFVKNNSGHFITISSMAGKFGVPVRSGYSAAKMALHGFFDALRAEHYGSGINVTMVCPGYIKTNISLNALTADGSAQGTMDNAQQQGMDVDVMANKVLTAAAKGQAEYHIGGFREVKMAGFVSRVFPRLFRRIIAKSAVT